jgi:carboxyl-terminal processing protease
VLVRKRLVVPVVASRIIGLRGARVGYIRLTSFTTGSGDAVRARTVRILRSHPRGLVLDLRGNGGGSVAGAYAIASLFLPKGATVLRMEGRHFPATTYRTRVAPIAPRLPVVVLVDHASASASEILAAALRDHRRAMIVGERTFGKAVVQDRRPLAGGAALHLTVARYYTPSGADLNHRGVAPDVRASDPLRTARDEALDLAADIARDS